MEKIYFHKTILKHGTDSHYETNHRFCSLISFGTGVNVALLLM